MPRLWGSVVLVVVACGAPITSTSVSGTVSGVGFSSPVAISHAPGQGASIFDAKTVIITDQADPCGHLVEAALFGPEGVNDSKGVRAASIIVQSGQAWFDVGGSATRLQTTSAKLDVTSTSDDSTLSGTFEADFAPNGTVSGTFIAPACKGLSSGCSATGASLVPLLTLALLERRRQKTRSARGTVSDHRRAL
jgi:hypothetical protein